MEAEDADLMAFLTAKLDGDDAPVASDIRSTMRKPNPLTTPYVDTSAPLYDDDIAAFLDLKESAYMPTSKKIHTPFASKSTQTIDDLLRLMSRATLGAAMQGQHINTPANTHDAQKMQLTADLRTGKSSISFPVLPVGLRLNAY